MSDINNEFIEELFKASITNKNTFDILKKHLSYSHLPTEAYKTVWKNIITFYEVENKLPTIGILSQSLEGLKQKDLKLDCKYILANVKKSKVENVHDELLSKFEDYVKEVDFVNLYTKVKDIYQENQKAAITYMAKHSEIINSFSLKDGVYDRVFADFEKRQSERVKKDPELNDERIPSGIHELDYYIRGGWKKGTSFLFLGRSGTGKSTFLRWCAISAARMGKRVVLFSLEGLREETLEAIDSAWTSTPIEDMEYGRLQVHKINDIKKSLKNLLDTGGEIFVHSNEGFDALSMEQANTIVHDIRKIYGDVDMVLFDYLELFMIGGTGNIKDSSGERRRREMIANKITDMAVEHRCVTGSATQASDIAPNIYNNPEFVLTRSHASEFKGVIKPFSYFITINQTDDEYEDGVCRLYCDKFRKHRSGQMLSIFQRMDINRFYDSNRTLKVFWDKEIKRKKNEA
jgi:replicative DNA helicase